jgi:hypothetical protein
MVVDEVISRSTMVRRTRFEAAQRQQRIVQHRHLLQQHSLQQHLLQNSHNTPRASRPALSDLASIKINRCTQDLIVHDGSTAPPQHHRATTGSERFAHYTTVKVKPLLLYKISAARSNINCRYNGTAPYQPIWRMQGHSRSSLAQIGLLVSPGTVSGHVHAFHGSLGMSLLSRRDLTALMASFLSLNRVVLNSSILQDVLTIDFMQAPLDLLFLARHCQALPSILHQKS